MEHPFRVNDLIVAFRTFNQDAGKIVEIAKEGYEGTLWRVTEIKPQGIRVELAGGVFQPWWENGKKFISFADEYGEIPELPTDLKQGVFSMFRLATTDEISAFNHAPPVTLEPPAPMRSLSEVSLDEILDATGMDNNVWHDEFRMIWDDEHGTDSPYQLEIIDKILSSNERTVKRDANVLAPFFAYSVRTATDSRFTRKFWHALVEVCASQKELADFAFTQLQQHPLGALRAEILRSNEGEHGQRRLAFLESKCFIVWMREAFQTDPHPEVRKQAIEHADSDAVLHALAEDPALEVRMTAASMVNTLTIPKEVWREALQRAILDPSNMHGIGVFADAYAHMESVSDNADVAAFILSVLKEHLGTPRDVQLRPSVLWAVPTNHQGTVREKEFFDWLAEHGPYENGEFLIRFLEIKANDSDTDPAFRAKSFAALIEFGCIDKTRCNALLDFYSDRATTGRMRADMVYPIRRLKLERNDLSLLETLYRRALPEKGKADADGASWARASITEYAAYLYAPSYYKRSDAADAGSAGKSAIMDFLLWVVEFDPETYPAAVVLTALAYFAGQMDLSPFIHFALAHPDSRRQEYLLEFLVKRVAEVQDVLALQGVLRIVTDHPDASVREEAVASLPHRTNMSMEMVMQMQKVLKDGLATEPVDAVRSRLEEWLTAD